MNRFPRYGPPFQYYNPYYRNGFYPNYKTPISEEKKTIPNVEKESLSKNNSRSSEKTDTVWFDLFGIKLYFDDVLIHSLLFFLYKEEVKDEGLFLALVMLLIS